MDKKDNQQHHVFFKNGPKVENKMLKTNVIPDPSTAFICHIKRPFKKMDNTTAPQ